MWAVNSSNLYAPLPIDASGNLLITGTTTSSDTTPVGTQGNMWSGATPAVDGTSTAINIQYVANVDIFGTVDGACELWVQLSQNDNDWYDSIYSYITTGSEDFHIT